MRTLAFRLESGSIDGMLARAAERAWARVADERLVKRLSIRHGARVVAIGGATLGGSGKTPLAIACARALAELGARVALVGHAYRASPRCPREVCPEDPVGVVGDEALVCARTLGPAVRVVVAPTRQAALDFALERADIAVLDGVHQMTPAKASLALLAVDSLRPWGAGACPPRGDLRASKSALWAASDCIVPVHARTRGVFLKSHESSREVLLDWDKLRGIRLGLVTALARPDRVLATLAAQGVVPSLVRTFSDHARPHLRSADSVDLWVATRKCAASMTLDAGTDLAVIDHEAVLEPELMTRLRAVATGLHDLHE